MTHENTFYESVTFSHFFCGAGGAADGCSGTSGVITMSDDHWLPDIVIVPFPASGAFFVVAS